MLKLVQSNNPMSMLWTWAQKIPSPKEATVQFDCSDYAIMVTVMHANMNTTTAMIVTMTFFLSCYGDDENDCFGGGDDHDYFCHFKAVR